MVGMARGFFCSPRGSGAVDSANLGLITPLKGRRAPNTLAAGPLDALKGRGECEDELREDAESRRRPCASTFTYLPRKENNEMNQINTTLLYVYRTVLTASKTGITGHNFAPCGIHRGGITGHNFAVPRIHVQPFVEVIGTYAFAHPLWREGKQFFAAGN